MTYTCCQVNSAGQHEWNCPCNPLNINPPTFTVHGCPQGCVDQVTDLKAQVSRLQGELDTERTRRRVTLSALVDEGNELYKVKQQLGAAEQARLEAVRELEAERIRHQQDVDIDSDCRRDLKSRLTKAEEALRGLHRWLTDPGVKVLCEGLPEQMGYSGACQKVVAALQPEGEKK